MESSPAMSVSTTTAILVTSEETMPVTTVSAQMPSVSGVLTTCIAPVLAVDLAVTHSVFGHGVSNTTTFVSAAETTPLASTVVGTVGTTTPTHDCEHYGNYSINVYSVN